jgi:hypothetical protein
MTLEEFHAQLRAETQSEIGDRIGSDPYPYAETVFCETVMHHMADNGMTFDPKPCHVLRKAGNATLRLSGYAVSDDGEDLDLFVTLYNGSETIAPVPDVDTRTAADQCLRFIKQCVEGRLSDIVKPTDDEYELVMTIRDTYAALDQIGIYVITDGMAKTKNFKPREIGGKTIKLEVMDIERLYRHMSEGRPRDELVVNFEEACGAAIPCIYVPAIDEEYDYALAAIPAAALRTVYEKYGPRLLEANVRSFLSQTGKVNKGIRDTLRDRPERFMAYNNGIVVVADEAMFDASGGGLKWLKGMQIVNGGQTTASIYFTKKKFPQTSLDRVRVPAKIIILKNLADELEETLIADISRYANSQNSVKSSDLYANRPYHVELERLAISTFLPDGVGRWFYERAAGSYNVLLSRDGTTPAKLRQLKESIPVSRKFTKTDLAKYLHAWDGKPDLVSRGSQKNFESFMLDLAASSPSPDVQYFKRTVSKIILFKTAQKMIRPAFPAFQANITSYTVSLVADRLREKIDLDDIWQRQALPAGLTAQIETWSKEVNSKLHATSNGRMISEWGKKPECWNAVQSGEYSTPVY